VKIIYKHTIVQVSSKSTLKESAEEELGRLRKENRLLKQERDILRIKGTSHFKPIYKPEFDNKSPIYRASKRQSFKKYPLNLAKARFSSIFFKI